MSWSELPDIEEDLYSSHSEDIRKGKRPQNCSSDTDETSLRHSGYCVSVDPLGVAHVV